MGPEISREDMSIECVKVRIGYGEQLKIQIFILANRLSTVEKSLPSVSEVLFSPVFF